MSDFLLQEDGASHVLLEDGASSVLLETSLAEIDPSFISSATVVYGPTLHRVAHCVGVTFFQPPPASNANTITIPAGVLDGDLLIAVFAAGSSDINLLAAAGWTQRREINSGNTRLAIYTKAANSEPSTYTFAGGGQGAGENVCLAYRGITTEVPDASAIGTTATVASLTPTASDDLEIYVEAAQSASSLTAPSEWNERFQGFVTVTGTNIYVADLIDYLGGTSPTGTVTPSGTTGLTPVSAHLLFRTASTELSAPFIASVTTLYTPALTQQLFPPFIPSSTLVYAPTLPQVFPSFIASKTRVFGVFSLYNPNLTLTGPGNGGETLRIRLAPHGTTTSATLAAAITSSSTALRLTGDEDLPASEPFVLQIDDEIVYVSRTGEGSYAIRARALSNTAAAAHTAGAIATWTDTYDMAIVVGSTIAHEFTADITGTGDHTYPGWLLCFDASQAYLAGNRYPMHVSDFLGIFDAHAGSTGANRCDATQANAIATPAATSDNCPSALAIPSRIAANILAGDVALLRYTNPEAAPLDLGPRSPALQSLFGMKRVDDTDNDVTFTDPAGHIVDGAINGVWLDPLGPGIAPSTGEPTNHDVPYTSVTLPGADRFFTHGPPGYNEKGWPICALAVRQGNRRIPYWQSWDWHDYSYVYSGYGIDATFVQLLVNRNGIIFGSVPEVELPGPQDIDGPDAVWDDGSYAFAASWYVAIYNTPYLVVGPTIGGGLASTFDTGPLPAVDFSAGVGSPTITVPDTTPPPTAEGGAGGGLTPPSGGGHVWARV